MGVPDPDTLSGVPPPRASGGFQSCSALQHLLPSRPWIGEPWTRRRIDCPDVEPMSASLADGWRRPARLCHCRRTAPGRGGSLHTLQHDRRDQFSPARHRLGVGGRARCRTMSRELLSRRRAPFQPPGDRSQWMRHHLAAALPVDGVAASSAFMSLAAPERGTLSARAGCAPPVPKVAQNLTTPATDSSWLCYCFASPRLLGSSTRQPARAPDNVSCCSQAHH